MQTPPGELRRWTILRNFGRIVAAALLVWLVMQLKAGWGELRARGVVVDFLWLALAVPVYVAVLILHAANWRWMLGRFGAQPTYREAVGVCGRSWLGRYLPGKLWVVGGKVLLGSRLGISRRTLAVVSLTELALLILVGGILGAVCLLIASFMGVPDLPGWPVAIVLLGGVVAILPPVFRRVLNFVARATGRRPVEPSEVPSVGSLLAIALRTLSIALFGSVLWFFYLHALLPGERVTPEVVILAIGCGPIGAIVGMVALFAPGGIGVREATQAGLLSAVLPAEEAIALALMARLVSVAGDAVFIGLGWLAGRGEAPSDAADADKG
jgi:uncharacterized membrane protein YbhN (UPF0104 family)